MALSVNLDLAQKQKLVMTQTLREAIELLQVSSVELAQRIEQELQDNPVLELKQTEPSEPNESSLPTEQSEVGTDSDFAGNFDDSSDEGYSYGVSERADPNAKQQFIEGVLQRSQTLFGHLIGQLRLITQTDEDYRIGETIISCLDEDGYLNKSLEELADFSPIEDRELADFERVLKLIQTLDPPGVAARSLSECLLIQLHERDTKDELAELIVAEHFSLLEKRNWKQISTKLGVSVKQVEDSARVIAGLEPYPGRSFATSSVEYVVPDVIIRQNEDGEFEVVVNDDWVPRLSISKTYRNLMRRKDSGEEVKTYIGERVSAAQWLIRSIEQRRETLYAVASAILDEQREFFLNGPGHLKPLNLKQIADIIGMHESTVSRVTSNKYVQTGWGLYRLKYFFSSALRRANGEYESSRSVKEMIRKIIEEEDKSLSDQEIVGILNGRGIKIARRTVAKYRGLLRIMPSSRRRS